MPRPKSETLTEREAEIMQLLWEQGSATAEDVRNALQGQPHDSTVRTLLRVVEQKGHVKHTVQGRTYIYHPVVRRDRLQKKAIKSVIARFFGGSAESLVLRLLEDEQISAEELREIAGEVSKKRSRRTKKEP